MSEKEILNRLVVENERPGATGCVHSLTPASMDGSLMACTKCDGLWRR